MAVLAAWDELSSGVRRYRYLPRNFAGPCARDQAETQSTQAQALREMTADATAQSITLVDIGANLLDPMFQGVYRDKARHSPDFSAVLCRAQEAGVTRIIVTAGSLQESHDALELCRKSVNEAGWPSLCCTVGVHPTRCSEFETDPEAHFRALLDVARTAAPFCCAVGECGLDYDRLEFCGRDVQLKFFEQQLLELAIPLQKPLFLHCRSSEAAEDLVRILQKHKHALPKRPGVVHSFDGSLEEDLPQNRILLETDAPWCGIKPSHAGYGYIRSSWEEVKKPERWEEGKCVKDRCEPCQMRQVLEVVAGCRGVSPEELAKDRKSVV